MTPLCSAQLIIHAVNQASPLRKWCLL